MRVEQVSSLVTHKLEAMVEAADCQVLSSKREAISALFIYVILEQGRQQRMANAISHALQTAGACRRATSDYIGPYTPMLFRGPNTPSMDSLIILLSPYIDWDSAYLSECDAIKWAAAASAVPYTEEVGWDIASALLQISKHDSLRLHIPLNIWTLLKKHSTPPPPYRAWTMEITPSALRYIHGLEDIELLKSIFILVWSKGNRINLNDTYNLFREEFSGIGMWGHRKDLLKWLDGFGQSGHYSRWYEELGYILRRLHREAVETLIRTLSELSFFYKYADSRKRGRKQNRTPHSPVLFPSPAHDFSPHVVNVWLQHPVLVLPPLPFKLQVSPHFPSLKTAVQSYFSPVSEKNCLLSTTAR